MIKYLDCDECEKCIGFCWECEGHLEQDGRNTLYCPSCDTCPDCGAFDGHESNCEALEYMDVDNAPYFDRFDICEAYLALEWDYHSGGILQERPSNRRRNMSTDFQLRRMGFKPGASFNGYRSLSDNGKAIYIAARDKYRLPLGNGR